jgi:hypothetical protein
VAIPRNPIYIAGNVVTGFEFPHVEILRGTRERLSAETSLPVTIFPAGGSSQHTARECLEPERTSVASGGCERPCRNVAIPRNPIYIAGNVVTGFEFPHVEILRGTRERLTAETSLPVTIFPAGGSSQHTARECLEPERTSVASGGCERPCRNVAIPRNPIYIAGNVVTIFPAGGSSQQSRENVWNQNAPVWLAAAARGPAGMWQSLGIPFT